jgi:cation diffusion facilitator CzcD-associated flavoprotein CzcO
MEKPSRAQLPPGYYLYTSQLPVMMKNISPIYTIPTEPVFLDHLLMHMGQRIHVETVTGGLQGVLTGAAVDHLQLTVDGVHFHIRYQHMIYFRKA